jgi:hypothetical protein
MIPLPNTLVSVQPMNGPSGHVFYLDYEYGGNMENTALNISPFLANLQFYMDDNFDYDLYRTKLDATIEKIDSLVDTLPATLLIESEYAHWSLDRSIAIEIRNTIGIYAIIPQKEREIFKKTTVWYKQVHSIYWGVMANLHGKDELHSTWQDWLGDEGITELGGKVVVSLSDTGVEYLNEVANRVASLTKEIGNPKTSQYLSPNG